MIRAVKEVEFKEVLPHLKSKRWAEAYKGAYASVVFDTVTGLIELLPADGSKNPKLSVPNAGNVTVMVLGATLRNDTVEISSKIK